MRGEISGCPPDKGHVFIKSGADEYYAHLSWFVDPVTKETLGAALTSKLYSQANHDWKHVRAVLNISEGRKVEFKPEPSEGKRPKAMEVRILL